MNEGERNVCPISIGSGHSMRKGKLLVAVLLGLTYMITGSMIQLLYSTELILSVHLNPSRLRSIRRMQIVLQVLQMGKVVGCVLGGLAFDFFAQPREKQVLFSTMLIIMALSCGSVPFFPNVYRVGLAFFVNGFSVTLITTGINAYLMGMYGENSHTGLQFIHAWFLFGSVSAKFGVNWDYRYFIENYSINYTNHTHGYEHRRKVFMKLFVSYNTLAAFLVVFSLAWICLYRFSPWGYLNDLPFDDCRQQKITQGFKTLAVVTTVPMFVLANFLHVLQVPLLERYAKNILCEDYTCLERTSLFHLMNKLVGRCLAVIIAYKFLTPDWMITLDLFVLMVAACLMLLLERYGYALLWVVVGLLGLSSASLIPATIAWLNTHIIVTGKYMGLMQAAYILINMTTHIWLEQSLKISPAAPVYYMLLIPISYAIMFIIQIILIRREKNNLSSHDLNVNQHVRFLCDIHRQMGVMIAEPLATRAPTQPGSS